MEGLGTEAFAIAPYASWVLIQVPWRRSSGPVRRTANSETPSCSLALSQHGEVGAARPSSAEVFLCVGEYKRVVSGDEERISSDGQRLWPVSCKGEWLRCEHFLQDREDSREGTGRDSSEPPDKTFAIDRAQLVHCDKPRAIAETTAYTPGVSLPPCGHWGYDDCP